MKAGLERRVRQLEEYAVRRPTPDEPMSDFDLARRVALILYSADKAGPPYPELAREIALLMYEPQHEQGTAPCQQER